MHFDPEQQLTADCLARQGAALRAFGRQLLGDGNGEDLAQDVWVAALQAPAPRGALGAWLTGITKRLFLLRRRSARRQRQRELELLRPDAVPSAAEVAAEGELLQRIAAAVQSLPESYRTPVLLRFWHDLPPRAIAVRLGLPVNTVRSRLQRALGMLRERLDALGPGRSAWAAPLLALVRPRGPMAGAVVGVGSVLTGVMSMGMKTKLVAAAVALIGVVVGFELLQAPSSAAAPGGGAPGSHARVASDQGPPVARREVAAVPSQLRGRCVAAENGAPLPGCKVALVADRALGQPLLPPDLLTSGADGCFAFEIEVAGGHGYRLLLFVAERVPLERSFAQLEPGELDLGDVQLAFGARVVGTVHDAFGNAAANVVFACHQIAEQSAPAGIFAPSRMPPLWSRPDGVLQMAAGAVFGPGTWQLRLQSEEHVLVGPRAFVVVAEQRTVELDVVVAKLADQPAIEGVLLDENGVPVPDVVLCAGDSSNRDKTAGDGSFAIHRRAGTADKDKLWLEFTEPMALRDPQAEYEWRSKDLRVVVRRPVGLWLQVAEAETGQPVTDYGVRLLRLDVGNRDSWESRGLRENGQHDRGLLQLQQVTPGRYRIVAYPNDPGLSPSEPVEAELGAVGASIRLECELAHALTVEVRTKDGASVAGSHIDLFRQEGEGELTNHSSIGSAEYVYEEFAIKNRPAFVVLDSGLTDGRGRVLLHGPGRGRIGVRVLGPHVPLLHAPIAIAGEHTRVVLEIERGAVLRGTLQPASVLPTLRPAASDWRWAGSHGECADPARPWPTLKLREVGGERRQLPWRQIMAQPGYPIADDGAFAIAGVPSGDWDLELQYGIGDAMQWHVIGRAERLRDGETRELELDIQGLIPGELHATLTLEGKPLANAEVYFGNGWVRTDSDGCFTRKVPAGTYRIDVEIGEGAARRLHSDHKVGIRSGELTTAAIDFVRRRLRVHLLRPDGSPAARQTFAVIGLSGEFQTDADGWLMLDPAPTWQFAVRYYAGGHDDAAMQKLAETDPAVWGRLRVDLGPVQMPLDRKDAEFELRMTR